MTHYAVMLYAENHKVERFVNHMKSLGSKYKLKDSPSVRELKVYDITCHPADKDTVERELQGFYDGGYFESHIKVKPFLGFIMDRIDKYLKKYTIWQLWKPKPLYQEMKAANPEYLKTLRHIRIFPIGTRDDDYNYHGENSPKKWTPQE